MTPAKAVKCEVAQTRSPEGDVMSITPAVDHAPAETSQ